MMHGDARDAGRVGLVSIARCASLLAEAGDKVDRSALSRYCDKHNLKRGRDGRDTLVNYEEVRDHRAASYQREVMSGRSIEAAADASPTPAPNVVAFTDPTKRRAQAQAIDAELDLAERMGELTAIAEVDAGVAESIVEMRSAFAGALHDEAERLAAELGLAPERVRTLRAGLKRFARIGQERYALRISRSLAAANEADSEAYVRIMTLAAQAMRLRSREPLAGAVSA